MSGDQNVAASLPANATPGGKRPAPTVLAADTRTTRRPVVESAASLGDSWTASNLPKRAKRGPVHDLSSLNWSEYDQLALGQPVIDLASGLTSPSTVSTGAASPGAWTSFSPYSTASSASALSSAPASAITSPGGYSNPFSSDVPLTPDFNAPFSPFNTCTAIAPATLPSPTYGAVPGANSACAAVGAPDTLPGVAGSLYAPTALGENAAFNHFVDPFYQPTPDSYSSVPLPVDLPHLTTAAQATSAGGQPEFASSYHQPAFAGLPTGLSLPTQDVNQPTGVGPYQPQAPGYLGTASGNYFFPQPLLQPQPPYFDPPAPFLFSAALHSAMSDASGTLGHGVNEPWTAGPWVSVATEAAVADEQQASAPRFAAPPPANEVLSTSAEMPALVSYEPLESVNHGNSEPEANSSPDDDDPVINSLADECGFELVLLPAAKEAKYPQLSVLRTDLRGKRTAFAEDKRQETSKTRGLGACVRCKMQRIRCVPNPESVDAACMTCLTVSPTSRKVIHSIPCKRWKMPETTWFRKDNLGLTRRWEGIKIKELDTASWADDIAVHHEIQVRIFYTDPGRRFHLCDEPFSLIVRKFRPGAGDVLVRKYTKKTESGDVVIEIPLAPYALVSTKDTETFFSRYFENYALSALRKTAEHAEGIVKHTYMAAVEHYESRPVGDPEKVFMAKLFIWWFAMRHSTGSDYICGPDKLGMNPVQDPEYPLGDKISLPRMVTHQMDCILGERFLRPLSWIVLSTLEDFFRSNNPAYWFTIYVSSFILLHEVSLSSADRRRHANQNGRKQGRYTFPNFVEDMQFGANIVLVHWHYFKTRVDPSTADWRERFVSPRPPKVAVTGRRRTKSKKKDAPPILTEKQSRIVLDAWAYMAGKEEEMERLDEEVKWEHPLYFVSQMFSVDWKVRDTWTAA